MRGRAQLTLAERAWGPALARAAAWAALVMPIACSTIADDPPPECQSDADCDDDQVCSLGQGGICVLRRQPPLPVLGFSIDEGAFSLELQGCDPEVTLEGGGNELRVQRRDLLARNFAFNVISEREVDTCEECLGSCDTEALLCREPVDAKLQLRQSSRFNFTALTSPKGDHLVPVDPPLPAGELPPPVTLAWPSYDTPDPAAHAATILDTEHITKTMTDPTSEATLRRVIAQELTVPLDEDTVPLEVVSLQRCRRGLFGEESVVRTVSGTPVNGALIEFEHAEPIATASTVLGGVGATCDEHEDCPIGWACGDQGSCGLDLRGVLAGTTKGFTDEEVMQGTSAGAFLEAWIYTYCEGIDAGADQDPLRREFEVRVTPPATSGLPAVVYEHTQQFPDPSSPGASRLLPFKDGSQEEAKVGYLCLPDWEPAHPVSFDVIGTPVKLIQNQLGDYRCCSTECLPTLDPDGNPTPPPIDETCKTFQRVRFSTRWVLDIEAATTWAFAGCIPTGQNEDGSNGRYVRDVQTCAQQPCSVDLTPGAADEQSRSYTVEILQPPTSVFRSARYQLDIGPDTTELEPFVLQPRVLLRGQIVCAEGSEDDCLALDAVVAVERLRTDTDENNPIGPFYFDARVDAEGNFVLPVEPGLYVITAYPGSNLPGGPAPFQIVDLRETSSLVQLVDGVPTAQLPEPLELDAGVLVTVLLRDFDNNTSVVPLDIGSWKDNPAFADFDLNDVDTCYGGSPRRGCQIRRLISGPAPTFLLLTKRLQVTARGGGPTKCSEG